jgi:LacI family transcriptional regulator
MSVRSLARELGVSATAVSLALKGSPRVSAELRQRVSQLAKKRGHVPNARLEALMGEVRRSAVPSYRGTIGVITLFPEERPWVERPLWTHLGEVVRGAEERAAAHGYTLEHLWAKRPGQTPMRLRTILEARGIRGLLCLGSLDPEERWPAELNAFAVATFAASIPDRLHRVISDFARDGRTLLDQLVARGYRRPGLVILHSGDRRTDHLYSAVFLSHQERKFGGPHVPVLRAETWDEGEFGGWFEAHRPDVLVLHQHADFVAALETWLRRKRLVVPRDVGLALLDKNRDRAKYSGICQNPARMGAVLTEMLLGRMLLGDFGAPAQPKIELVQGEWNEGRTIRGARG